MSERSTAAGLNLEIISLNVGQPEPLGKVRGRMVRSAIAKTPVTGPSLYLGETNLEGDRQADLAVHGGPDKAVYAYPVEHLARWSAELDMPIGPAFFGENLTLRGANESEIWIGDIFQWDDATLQVTQPRTPCFKLALRAGRPDLPKRLTQHARSGWYLRVLQPGTVSVSSHLRLLERDPSSVSVLDTFRALHSPEATPDDIKRVLSAPSLLPRTGARLNERLKHITPAV